MFGFLKRRFVVAEVDGIRFYSDKSLRRYLEEREKNRSSEGMHMYTFEIPWYMPSAVSRARVHLEKNGCFDYEVSGCSDSGYVVRYWSPEILLTWAPQ